MTQFITKNGKKIPITNTGKRMPVEVQNEEEQDKPQDLTSIIKKKSQQEQ
jgi:hypothetical protein